MTGPERRIDAGGQPQLQDVSPPLASHGEISKDRILGHFTLGMQEKLRGAEFGSARLLAAGDTAALLHAEGAASTSFLDHLDNHGFGPVDANYLSDITCTAARVSAIEETIRIREQTVPGYKGALNAIREVATVTVVGINEIPSPSSDNSHDFSSEYANATAQLHVALALQSVVEAIEDNTQTS